MPSSDRIDELKKRYDENPRRFFASLANEYRKAGDLDQAISLCQQHLAEQPGNMNGHVVYGQALFEAGRYDEAKVTFETALTLDPENLIALRHLGDIACTNGANEQARIWYVRVLDADPRNDEIIALLAHLENEAKKEAVSAPVAAATPIASLTPIVPIESVNTLQTPAVPPPRETLGLMDLSIDFDSAPASPLSAEPASNAELDVDSHFPAFEEVKLGVPLESVPPAEEPPGDLMMDPFADPAPGELLTWEPAPIEDEPPLIEAATPVAASRPPDDNIDMLFGDTLPAEPAPPFVTETMAELYLQQGFVAEALDVYRQLSAQFPDDENLKERVRKLERGDRTSLPLDVIPDHEYTADGAVPLGGMLDDLQTPVASHAPIAEPQAEQHGEQRAAPRHDAEAGVVSARSYFAALASRRAVQGNARARTAPRVSSPRVSASHAAAPIISLANITSLDELFAGGAISPEDEQVALAFAQVAGAAEMGGASVRGKPTAPAATELSLDSVFRDADSRGAATVPRQSQTLRFDQFFATAGDDAGAPHQPPVISAPVGEPGSPAEIKQFQSWLTGLKKP